MVEDDDPLRPSFRTAVRYGTLALVLLILLHGAWTPAAAGPTAETPPPPRTFTAPVAVALLCLLGLSAFFSGSETALFSISRIRLREIEQEDTALGRVIVRLLDNPGRLLTTVLIGNTVANVLAGVILGVRIQGALAVWIGASPAWTYFVAAIGAAVLLVLFGEVVPKVLAASAGERMARAVAIPLSIANKALTPLADLLIALTDLVFRLFNYHELRAAPFITDDEFRSVLSGSEAEAVLEEDERQMIRGILEFGNVLLREILVPRPDVVCLPEDSTVADALELIREHEYSRMPVYRDSLDSVVGILVAKDLIPLVAKGRLDQPIAPLLRPPHFVPETMTVRQFVDDARRRRSHLAIVVDEYGGAEGIATLEDALEEVVGDIRDEDEDEPPHYVRLDANRFRVEGCLRLDEVKEILNIDIDHTEHETLAGYLMDQLDKVPEPGDIVTDPQAVYTVETCEGKRLLSVLVEILRREQTPEADGRTAEGTT